MEEVARSPQQERTIAAKDGIVVTNRPPPPTVVTDSQPPLHGDSSSLEVKLPPPFLSL